MPSFLKATVQIIEDMFNFFLYFNRSNPCLLNEYKILTLFRSNEGIITPQSFIDKIPVNC